MKMTERELSEIKQRVESASPGPWRSFIEGRDHTSGSSFIMTGVGEGQEISDVLRGEDLEFPGISGEDQDFIANARQDIPRLLDHISILNREIQELKNGG